MDLSPLKTQCAVPTNSIIVTLLIHILWTATEVKHTFSLKLQCAMIEMAEMHINKTELD